MFFPKTNLANNKQRTKNTKIVFSTALVYSLWITNGPEHKDDKSIASRVISKVVYRFINWQSDTVALWRRCIVVYARQATEMIRSQCVFVCVCGALF